MCRVKRKQIKIVKFKYFKYTTKGSYIMRQTINPDLLDVKPLNYYDYKVENGSESFINYEIDTDSYTEDYDREEDQEIRFSDNTFESCKVTATDSEKPFANMLFERNYINDFYINSLSCYNTYFKNCSIKTLSFFSSIINYVAFDGTNNANLSRLSEDEKIPLYSADCIVLNSYTVLDELKLETFRVKHLIINTNNRDSRLTIRLKDYGITKNSKIDKITISSNIRIRILDYTNTFSDTEIVKVGEGLKCKIIMGDI